MITREEMQEVLKRKERQSSKAVKVQAKKTMEYASRLIKKGQFSLPNGPTNPEVINLIQKSFKKEGIDVKVEVSQIPSRSKKQGAYVKQCANYRFSLIEEQ